MLMRGAPWCELRVRMKQRVWAVGAQCQRVDSPSTHEGQGLPRDHVWLSCSAVSLEHRVGTMHGQCWALYEETARRSTPSAVEEEQLLVKIGVRFVPREQAYKCVCTIWAEIITEMRGAVFVIYINL